MATPIMIYSRLNGNVIDIADNSTQSGALLDAYPSKAHLKLTGPPATLAANQTWQVQPNPDGPDHFIIQNPATGYCIDLHDNSTSRAAKLEVSPVKKSDNQSQLWDFLPDPYVSGYVFIQNPQTGYVIEIENGSSTAGASLVVNPRRLFDNSFQLWAGTENAEVPDPSATPSGSMFTAFELASPTADLKSAAQYVLLPKDQSNNLTGIIVTLDIVEDLVADSFSVQINGNPPYPAPKGASWQTQLWMQYGLFMQNNGLFLFTQWYPVGKPPFPGPLQSPSVQESSPHSMLQLQNNTVPAGTQIVLTLTIDSKNDYVTGVSGKVFDKSGASIGTPDSWSAIGQPTWVGSGPSASPTGPPLQESDLSPLGAFQVVVVGDPDSNDKGHAHFTSGMGTITVSCTPELSAQLYWPSPAGGGTAETSNCYYGKVQEGYFPQIAQPFGLPRPKITSVSGDFTFVGNGLLPNSKLSANAAFTNGASPGAAAAGTVYNSGHLVSQSDGSFSLMIYPPSNGIAYTTVSTTVFDADKNWATGVTSTIGPPTKVTSTSGLSP